PTQAMPTAEGQQQIPMYPMFIPAQMSLPEAHVPTEENTTPKATPPTTIEEEEQAIPNPEPLSSLDLSLVEKQEINIRSKLTFSMLLVCIAFPPLLKFNRHINLGFGDLLLLC